MLQKGDTFTDLSLNQLKDLQNGFCPFCDKEYSQPSFLLVNLLYVMRFKV